MAIAEHEHVPEIAAAAMGRYLLKKPDGAEQIRDMIRDDIHEALSRDDKDHASELLMVLRHFVATHPEVQAGKTRSGTDETIYGKARTVRRMSTLPGA
jgi:hypothetical protein